MLTYVCICHIAWRLLDVAVVSMHLNGNIKSSGFRFSRWFPISIALKISISDFYRAVADTTRYTTFFLLSVNLCPYEVSYAKYKTDLAAQTAYRLI